MALAAELNSKVDKKVEELDEKLLREFASQASGDLCPMQAVIGGMAAQEVMKVSWYYHVQCIIEYLFIVKKSAVVLGIPHGRKAFDQHFEVFNFPPRYFWM